MRRLNKFVAALAALSKREAAQRGNEATAGRTFQFESRSSSAPTIGPVIACLCLAFVAMGMALGAPDEIYHFLDERGVPHFSNVPADARYRLILRSTAAPRLDATADSLAVIVFAPPMVDRGSEFAVNVVFANFAAVQGWLEIGFDPAMLTLVGTSVDHDAQDAGRVRVKVHGGPSAPSSADLHFLARGRTSDPTAISVTQSSLKTGKGEPVVASLPPPALVAISSFGR